MPSRFPAHVARSASKTRVPMRTCPHGGSGCPADFRQVCPEAAGGRAWPGHLCREVAGGRGLPGQECPKSVEEQRLGNAEDGRGDSVGNAQGGHGDPALGGSDRANSVWCAVLDSGTPAAPGRDLRSMLGLTAFAAALSLRPVRASPHACAALGGSASPRVFAIWGGGPGRIAAGASAGPLPGGGRSRLALRARLASAAVALGRGLGRCHGIGGMR